MEERLDSFIRPEVDELAPFKDKTRPMQSFFLRIMRMRKPFRHGTKTREPNWPRVLPGPLERCRVRHSISDAAAAEKHQHRSHAEKSRASGLRNQIVRAEGETLLHFGIGQLSLPKAEFVHTAKVT